MANGDSNGARRSALLIGVAATVMMAASIIFGAYIQWVGQTVVNNATNIAKIDERLSNRYVYYGDKFADLRNSLAELKARLELQSRVEKLEEQVRRQMFRRWHQNDDDPR